MVSREKIVTLQVLRAFAFLGIFLSHTETIKHFEFGAWGVSVFIILSGFLMYYNHYDDKYDISIGESLKFSLKRIKKLYPLHIFTMLLALVFATQTLLGGYAEVNSTIYSKYSIKSHITPDMDSIKCRIFFAEWGCLVSVIMLVFILLYTLYSKKSLEAE